jgi:LysR family hydrogen peroxide-inducible transcriptional activator
MITAAGAAVLDRARRTLVDADDVVAAAERARDPMTGTLRVGLIPTVAPYLLPDVAPVLRARHPRLQLLWFEDKTRTLLEQLAAGALDAAVVAGESELGDLETAPIGRDPFLLAVPPGHPLARGQAPVRPDDLRGETVLLLDDGHCFRDQSLAVCSRVGADEASIRATSLSTLAQMVAGGAGITLLPAIAVATENRARGLAIRRFGPRGPARTLVLAWRKTAPSEVALRAIAETTSAVVTKLADAR